MQVPDNVMLSLEVWNLNPETEHIPWIKLYNTIPPGPNITPTITIDQVCKTAITIFGLLLAEYRQQIINAN